MQKLNDFKGTQDRSMAVCQKHLTHSVICINAYAIRSINDTKNDNPTAGFGWEFASTANDRKDLLYGK